MILFQFMRLFTLLVLSVSKAENSHRVYYERQLLQVFQDETKDETIRLSTDSCDISITDCATGAPLNGYIYNTDGCDPQLQDCTGKSPGQYSSPNLQEPIKRDTDCTDIAPQNATSDCSTYFALELCNEIEEQYCKFSCGRCVQCEDKLFPGTKDCTAIVALGNCQDENIKGAYCNKSCGFCLTKTSPPHNTPTPPPTATPTPTITPAPVPPPTPTITPTPTLFAPVSPTRSRNEMSEIDALFSFKNSFNSAKLLDLWEAQSSGPCELYFVVCASGKVISIDLNGRKVKEGDRLYGSIAPELSVLTSLRSFQVHENYLTGTLPEEFSEWGSSMEEFKIFSNKFIGSLPVQYSTWKNLKKFWVSDNQLSGNLHIEYSTWGSSLEMFFAWENLFTGRLPKQYSTFANKNRTQEQDIVVHNNKLTGGIPVEYSTQCCVKYEPQNS